MAFEQVPYVAQVGGPVAGFLKHNPLTLGESRENGVKALKGRLSEISSSCPSADVAVLGYSQGALVAGDVLSEIGNGRGPINASRIVGAGLLSDPARTPTTANLDSDKAPTVAQVIPGSETLVGPNVPGQGVVGARPDGFGVLADRVTSFCAEGDAICSLTGKSPAIAAVVPLLNLRKQDIGPYVTSRVTTLLTNIATTPPEDMQRAITSVMTAATQLTAAGTTNPAALPLELARIVFASSTLDDIGKVVRMPEYDAFLSLTKPDQLVTQAVDVANYALLGVHQAYDRRPVNAQGDTATVFLAKWLLGRIQSS
ncbi:MAG: cutinase family protein [Gordonia sp. (in: high G+C Gram-positive bacteria)]|nr:cutinase family protein [Gordonia sp. (in: high G+C Gram-positive bacteria)]